MIAHNGEINTLRGNVNWMRAREIAARLRALRRRPRRRCCRSSAPGGSDSANFDNVLELLVLAGRSLPHAMMMMIPEAYDGRDDMHRRAARLLRLPRLPDGAVGRARRDRVHRRHRDRRDARPQRPASRALVGDEGRLGRAWPPRPACSTSPPRTSCARAGCSPGRSSSSTSARGRIVEDDEIKARDRDAASRTASGSRAACVAPERPARAAAARAARSSRCARASSRSATRRRTCA